jgi:hypothetical protein
LLVRLVGSSYLGTAIWFVKTSTFLSRSSTGNFDIV